MCFRSRSSEAYEARRFIILWPPINEIDDGLVEFAASAVELAAAVGAISPYPTHSRAR